MELELSDDLVADDAPIPSVDGITHFDFRHKVFGLPGAYLSPDHQNRPQLHVRLGDVSAAMPEESIRREFGIKPDDHDFKLINLTAQALRHVPVVTPGDALPTEIIDGTASWPIRQHHHDAARHRLLLQLAAWAANEEAVNAPPSQMARMLEVPEVKANLKKGFSDAAATLGLEDREAVVALLESAAREMAYIEALREYFSWILKIPKDIKQLQTHLKSDREALESAIRSHQLIMPPLRNYRDLFLEIEVLFAEVVHVLATLPAAIRTVRQVRDDLHRQTMIWATLRPDWQNIDPSDKNTARENAALIYSFLARNFLNVR